MVGPVDYGSRPMKAEIGKWNDYCNTNSCSIDSGVGARCCLVGVVHGDEWQLLIGMASPLQVAIWNVSPTRSGFVCLTLRLEMPEPTL